MLRYVVTLCDTLRYAVTLRRVCCHQIGCAAEQSDSWRGQLCDDGAGHPGRTPQLCQSRLLGGQQVSFVMTELGTLGGHLNCVRAVFSADNR